ncbi:MAG: hypothetical protein IJ697_05030 [Synergistaceae bacterium]|nr:hypothetical protein [Synergistaceae bacterium]
MEAVLERPKQKYKFDRKLGDEEIEELVENYDYTPEYEDDDGEIWDRFGNPTEATIRARYEAVHGIGEGPMTLDEFDDLLDEWRREADDEEAQIQNVI